MSQNQQSPPKKDSLLAGIAEGTAPDTTDTNLRYAGYAARVKTIMAAGHRYLAFTSEVGEAFRPVAHPRIVTTAYGISWAYIVGDVAYEAWKAHLHQKGLFVPGLKPWDPLPVLTEEQKEANKVGAPDWKLQATKRAVFQTIASMALPAFTVHSTVRYSALAFKHVKNTKIRTWGPVGLGLAVVPALPTLFDEPLEHAVDWVFDRGAEFFVDPKAVKSA